MGPPGLPGSAASGGSGGADFTGSGNPQGVQTGSAGQTYRDTTNNILYVKLAGASTNTGWYRVIGDTEAAIGTSPARWSVASIDNITTVNATNPLSYGIGALSSSTVSLSGSSLADGPAINMSTTSSTNGGLFSSNFSNTTAPMLWQWNFDISFRIHTDDTSLTNAQYWVGFTTANPSGGAISGRCIVFRYINGTDTGWVGYTNDNTGASVTATVASIAAATSYVLRIRRVGGTTVYFSVNDGAETSTTSKIPSTSDTNRAYFMVYFSCSAGTHNLYFLRAGGWWGTN